MMTKHRNLVLLYILPLVAVVVSLVTKANMLSSLLLFWGLPSLLLTVWAPKKALKSFLFAGITTLFCIALDLVFYITKQWHVVSMFRSHLLGIVSWEDVPYFFLYIYFPIMFWEYFYDKQTRDKSWTKKMTRLALVFILASIALVATWAWAPKLLMIPYFYLLVLVVLIILPLSLEIVSFPHLSFKFLRVGLFFAYVAIFYELTSIYLGQWYYPSTQFIGWVEIVGQKFPIEEFFAWILLGAVSILSWYEYFDDDEK